MNREFNLPNHNRSFERMLSSVEAASLLGIHFKTLQRLARQGAIPGHYYASRWFFRASELDAWLRSRLQCA
jgi:excisionase family DNA binding protein